MPGPTGGCGIGRDVPGDALRELAHRPALVVVLSSATAIYAGDGAGALEGAPQQLVSARLELGRGR
jgi:hypothetical protein